MMPELLNSETMYDFLWAESPQEPGFARQYFLPENIGPCPVLVFLKKNKNLYISSVC